MRIPARPAPASVNLIRSETAQMLVASCDVAALFPATAKDGKECQTHGQWSHLSSQRGSSLLLVIWAVMLMSVSVMGVMEFISYSVDENVVAAKDFRALHLAECGISLGLHPQLKPGDPVLKQTTGSDSGFNVLISSEGARLPINNVTEEIFRNACYELFVYWGLSTNEASIAADSLADWVDTNDDPRSQGAESDYYQGLGYDNFPRQQGFSSLEEMLLVRGMDAVERVKPDWRNYFSIHGDGMVDVNNASKDILMAVCGAQEGDVENLIRSRNGADGIQGTEDDVQLTLEQASSLLGLTDERFNQLETSLTAEHLTRRVESTGRIGESTYKVIVIARRQSDGSLNYLAREED